MCREVLEIKSHGTFLASVLVWLGLRSGNFTTEKVFFGLDPSAGLVLMTRIILLIRGTHSRAVSQFTDRAVRLLFIRSKHNTAFTLRKLGRSASC
jgi:hypothetical protein